MNRRHALKSLWLAPLALTAIPKPEPEVATMRVTLDPPAWLDELHEHFDRNVMEAIQRSVRANSNGARVKLRGLLT